MPDSKSLVFMAKGKRRKAKVVDIKIDFSHSCNRSIKKVLQIFC